jgi:hypothetical protein
MKIANLVEFSLLALHDDLFRIATASMFPEDTTFPKATITAPRISSGCCMLYFHLLRGKDPAVATLTEWILIRFSAIKYMNATASSQILTLPS